MKKLLPFYLLLGFLFTNQWLLAQTATLTGSLLDTASYKPMAFSAVTLLRKDSSMAAKQFTDAQSRFKFLSIKPDTYRLLICRPGFADYEEIVPLAENENKDLGNITLISKTNLLREVIIKDRQAIKIKGDTIEFLVDSFLTNKNANVEELLKKLPGIQVDKSGKITAQGQEVKRVLVDGEEFFGNDPTMATRNLQAENVETVQVFDKKSEQTAFTGIDDGTKEKTINLTLKEDAKKGYFGKLRGAYGSANDISIPGVASTLGTENRYEGEAMVNRFKAKQKASAYSIISNTNNTDLNWEERDQYGGGNNVEYDEATGYMYSYFERGDGEFDGNGIPQTRNIGAHFSDKVNNDKQSYQISANHRNTQVNGLEKDYSQWILPDTTYYNTILTNTQSNKTNNSVNGKADFKLDSLSTLVVRFGAKQSLFNTERKVGSENYNEENTLVNKNNRTNSSEGNTLNLNYALTWNKKFKTTGRTLSVKFDHKINQAERTGKLFSSTVFYNGDSSVNSEQNLDQLTPAEENGYNIGSNVTYTEPLNKKLFLVSSYDFHLTRNRSTINTFNPTPSGGYLERVDSLSNDLNYNIQIQKGELFLRYVTKKTNLSAGGKISHTLLSQENVITDTTLNQNFLNLFPSLRFNYKISSTTGFNINYYGSTRQPTLQQINPIQNLSNPLIVFEGNPNLEQSFSNNFEVSYNSYKPISGRSLWMNLNVSNTFNDFANYDEVDELGRRVYKSVNVDGNYRANLYTYYYFKIKAWNLGLGNNLGASIFRNANYINTLENINLNTSINYNLNLSYEEEDKYEIYLSPGIDYNQTKTSLRPDVITQFYTYNIGLYVNVYLPKKFEWNLSVDHNNRPATGTFVGLTNTLVDLSLSRKFMEKDQLELSIGVKDLLNQNVGFERNASSNYVNERSYIVLKRYFLFGVTWHIKSKTGGSND